MKTNYMTGIDIGTNAIKIVTTEYINSSHRIIHSSKYPNRGFRHGYINDIEAAKSALSDALSKHNTKLETPVRSAKFSIGGVGLSAQFVRTSIEIAKKPEEIHKSHIQEIQEKAENLFEQKYPNKKVLHLIPTRYQVDAKDTLGSPAGMYGESIEVRVLFITILEHHFDSFIELIKSSPISIDGIIAKPLADAAAAINYQQKTQGCLVINIGAETTTFSSFENGSIYSLETSAIGSNDITNDIALGLQIPLKEAESIKTGQAKEFPKKKTEEIIQARLGDIVELTERHLKKIKKQHLLPAGVILTGSAYHLEELEPLIKNKLRLSAQHPKIEAYSHKTKRMRRIDGRYSVAYGLCILETDLGRGKKSFDFSRITKKLKLWLKEMMP